MKFAFLLLLTMTTLFFMACESPYDGPGPLEVDSLAEKYASYFPIGAAVGPTHLSTVRDILAHHFNHITCENDMKMQPMQPTAGGFTPQNADITADFASTNSMEMTGHALLWHRQAPDWMFDDLTPGDAADIETLKTRMQTHIEYMVERYDDVVDNWDVVNEAVSDGNHTYRNASEGSRFYEIFGDHEYIYWAFKYARDALDALPGGSDTKLYYNDYSVPGSKLTKIMELVEYVGTDPDGAGPLVGITIDGIGLQAHWNLTWPSTTAIQNAFDTITAEGMEVKISELDISIYANGDEAEKSFTNAIETEQAERYDELFTLFRQNAADITSVTLWGVSDDRTWLDTFPTTRNNYPLLFDDNHNPKEAFFAIMDF